MMRKEKKGTTCLFNGKFLRLFLRALNVTEKSSNMNEAQQNSQEHSRKIKTTRITMPKYKTYI